MQKYQRKLRKMKYSITIEIEIYTQQWQQAESRYESENNDK